MVIDVCDSRTESKWTHGRMFPHLCTLKLNVGNTKFLIIGTEMQRENKCFPVLPFSHSVSKTTMSEKGIDIFGQLHFLSFVDYLSIKFHNDFRYGLFVMQTTLGGGGGGAIAHSLTHQPKACRRSRFNIRVGMAPGKVYLV